MLPTCDDEDSDNNCLLDSDNVDNVSSNGMEFLDSNKSEPRKGSKEQTYFTDILTIFQECADSSKNNHNKGDYDQT